MGRPDVTGRALQRSEHRAVILFGDLIALVIAIGVSLWLWSLTAGFGFSPAFLWEHAIWFLAVGAWAIALAPAYSMRNALSVGPIFVRLLQAAAFLMVAYLAFYFYAPRYQLPRLMALYVVWEGLLCVLAWRLIYAWFFSKEPFALRVLIVGHDRAARTTMLRLLRDCDFRNSTVVAVVDSGGTHGSPTEEGVPVLAGSVPLANRARELGVREIVLADAGAQQTLFPALAECQELGIDIVTPPQVYEHLLRRVPVAHLDSTWLFTSLVESVRAKDASLLAKRALDIAGASLGLAVLLAIAPFVALCTMLDSGRPVFYRQVRTGRAGREFVMLKFRTMVQDAERDTGPRWSGAGDPRVTRVGRILRKLRLDELPNLLNVLRGEMSLVGPRPERPELVPALARDIPFYRTRLMLRPGLTGWAQVNHPYGDSVPDAVEKLEYDLYYLKHRSMPFDLRILVRTVGTVLRFEGR
jgi:exopolysaccharide biosynthesis polyprenyl glycosylphosphotransferase